METKQIFKEVDDTLAEFIKTVSAFSDEQLNAIPFEGSWTPGQVTQHVILSVSGFVDLLYGPVTDTTRQYDEHVANLKATFLNFDIKLQSPDFILPPAVDYKKEELLHNLEQLKTKLNQFDQTSDMTKTCIGFELPVVGYLTRTEAAHFLIYHTQRHVHQLKKIYSKINQTKLIEK